MKTGGEVKLYGEVQHSTYKEIFSYLPLRILQAMDKLPAEAENGLEELRMRSGQALLCYIGQKEWAFDLLEGWTSEWKQPFQVSEEEIRRTMAAITEHSRYAFAEALRRGFITLPGGHRVGLSGQTLCTEGQVAALRYINGLNFRIAHECIGCADEILSEIYDTAGNVYNVLLVSPPRCGKTTLLRELCRQISNGNRWGEGRTVAVIDERSEIAGSFLGVPQLDVGMRTDVLDGCPKAEGMVMALRALSPQVMITDEISRREDAQQLRECVFSGVGVITSVHAENFAEVNHRPGIRELLREGVFDRVVVLSRRKAVGTVEEVIRCQAAWKQA